MQDKYVLIEENSKWSLESQVHYYLNQNYKLLGPPQVILLTNGELKFYQTMIKNGTQAY